jgi:glycosidase
VDLSPAQPEPLRLEPGNHQPQSLPLETQFRGRDLPSGRIDFATTERPDGTLNIRVTGRGTLVVTSDGTIPDRNNPSDSTIIAENSVELVITNPTILRAKSYDERGASTLRSKSFVPRLVELSLRQLPRNADVTGVYVTGPFRGWSSALEEPYRLQRNPEGNYRIRLKDTGPQREGRFLYKFLLKLRNGETLWWLDPAAPQTGVGEFANNFAPSNLEMLANKFLRNTPGFIEEAALDLRLQPVAALDQGDGIVRISLGFLENDVESVTIKFLNGQTANLQKSSYRRENISYDRFSGLVALPEGNTSSGFVLAVQDGSARLRVGSTGILGTDESLTDGNTFPFAYDSEASTLNGQDIYQVPLWSVDANWYQIFPERFRNGDTSNDRAFIPQAWQAQLKQAGINIKPELREWTSDWFVFSAFEQKLAQAVTGRLPNTTERDIQREIVLGRRYGGDLEGIRQQIQYLKSLNINAVYLNPVFDSDSNHKYDTKDYRHVDRYFGPMRKASFGADPELYPDDERLLRREDLLDPSTWEFTRADKLFVKLVNELQANGIRVVIDGVYNHSASSSLFMEDIAKRGRASRFYPWFEMAALGDSDFPAKKCNLSEFYPDRNLYPEASKIGYDAWFGYCTLPNHREGYPDTVLHPELAEHIFNVTKRWLGPQEIDGIPFAGVDGVRLDVYGDINQDYWRLYRKQVKSIKKDALIIAEEWYDGFDILKGDQTDVLMNYTVRTLAEGWFINTNAQERFRPSQASGYADFRLNNQRDHVRYALWSMLDSHDTDRMMSKTLFRNRGLSPRPQDGNSWDDGSVNRPDLGAPYSNDAPGPAEIEFFKGIIGFQTAYMGSPMLYYGNEQGMWGSDDPTCRKPMMWPDLFLGGDYETRCVTNSGLWCQLDQQTRFEMRPNADLFATYQRLFRARTNSNALRRGSLKTQLQVIVDGRNLTTGVQSSDYLWLWGFERAFAGREFAYFLSNQNNSRQALSVSLATRFQPGQPIVDLLSGAELTADSAGWVTLDIPRERAVLLIEKTALGL